MSEIKNGNKQKIIKGLLTVILVVGIAGGIWYWWHTTQYVSTDDARISGTIVNVSSKVTGKIAQITVAEGDRIKKGQVIAQIDPQDIGAQRAQAEATLELATANYDQAVNGLRPQEIRQVQASAALAKANLDNAEKSYNRIQQLYEDGAVSASNRDNTYTTYQVAKETYKSAIQGLNMANAGSRKEAIRAAAAQVKQAEAALNAIILQCGETTIVSPVDGIVALKLTNPGEVVVTGQPLFSVINSNDLWVSARIEETGIGKLKIGQDVEYTIDGYPGRTCIGKIFDIGSATDSVFSLIPTENASNNFTKTTQRVPIKIGLPENSDLIFRPGMSVVIKIHLV